MAIASRPKPKVQHKKRKAMHHQHTNAYLKPYWPYLPMVAIVGFGAYLSAHWPASLAGLNANMSGTAQGLTRIEAMTGSQNSWSLALIILMTAIAAVVFVTQHWFRVKRALNRGERLIVKHPLFDIALVAICTIGIILTRTN